MKYINNWEERKQRYNATWAKENHDRPLVLVSVADSSKKPVYDIGAPASIREKWLNFDWVIKNVRNNIERTYYAAESLPIYNPNLGPDIFGAILGCDIEFGENTSWCTHPVKDWDDFKAVYDPENIWLKRIIELTRMAVEEAKGDFMVGVTDIHSGMDGLVSLRGPAELCMDLYDCPEKIAPLPMQTFEVYKRFYNELESITATNQEGSVNWMGIWHPKRWYVTSCDFNCMVSNEIFKDYIEPELIAETEFLDANLYHLDGPGALVQLDSLLALPKVNGIQWVPGSGGKPMREWLPILKKCQDAGKMLNLGCTVWDLPALSEVLKPEGVILGVWGATEPSEADAALKMVERLWYHKKVW